MSSFLQGCKHLILTSRVRPSRGMSLTGIKAISCAVLIFELVTWHAEHLAGRGSLQECWLQPKSWQITCSAGTVIAFIIVIVTQGFWDPKVFFHFWSSSKIDRLGQNCSVYTDEETKGQRGMWCAQRQIYMKLMYFKLRGLGAPVMWTHGQVLLILWYNAKI